MGRVAMLARQYGLSRDHMRGLLYRDAGRCYCGRPPEPGRKSCDRCLARAILKARRYRARKKAAGVRL